MTGQVITVAQQKGGSGKTTLAINLAGAWAAAGARVALIDTDPQGSMGRWFMARRERMGGDTGLDFATASAWGVSYECEKLRRTHDWVIVDTPPKIDADLRPALRESDLVLVPVAVSQLDLWACESVLELAARERREVLLVLNRAPPRARLTAEVAAGLAEFAADRAEVILGNRVIYAETLGDGSCVTERRRNSAAANEIEILRQEIAARMVGSAG